MEKSLKIKTKDSHLISGTLNTSKKVSDKLVIFVHGLGGHQNEHIFYNAARFFPAKGYDTFRFDLYGPESGRRKFTEATVSLHAFDTNEVVRYFAKKYKKIYLVGHSLGGPTILRANPKANAIVLWDPSREVKGILEGDDIHYEKCLDQYVANWEIDIIIGRPMKEESDSFPTIAEMIKDVQIPIKIIIAYQTVRKYGKHGRDLYYKNANEPKALYEVKGADHNFNQEGKEEELFRETLSWFKKH